ncbi:MAG: hypothetical protein L3J39_14655 [Verrucomicrobiales bacterium]|nr:hypothetical protein [Verrucomicrobiales bacterium]
MPASATQPAPSKELPTSDLDNVAPSLLLKQPVTPMEAVNKLYSEGNSEISEAIIASLSQQIFSGPIPKPAPTIKRWLAVIVFQVLKRTTTSSTKTGHDGQEFISYQNSILERSDHPYAHALLETSGADAASFVEGGDPMNAPYMMISPEIRSTSCTWDRLLLDSVQGKDVQLRFICEARATLKAAKARLDKDQAVRLKAAAAGTGLSMILVFDRLIREGYDPALITMAITDRCPTNITKINRLLNKLSSTRSHLADSKHTAGIFACTEDLLDADQSTDAPYDIITLIGILEYFHGFTATTTEEHLGHPSLVLEPCAKKLAHAIAAMTAKDGNLITNTYRVETGARILELFGKRFRYRNCEDLHALVDIAGFTPIGSAGSGHIYDVEVYQKRD